MTSNTYTYQGGRKIELIKKDDAFVVRALPSVARAAGLPDPEQVSSASSRVHVAEERLESSMQAARALGPTHHSYEVASTGAEFLLTDRIFIHFIPSCTAEDVAKIAGKYGLVLLQSYSAQDYLFQLTNHTGMNPVKLVVQLTEQEPQVESAEHDLNMRAKRAIALPTDAQYAQQWHLHERLVHAEFDRRASARVEGAWNLLGNFGRSSVVVGVTDDGCRLDHADFDSANKFAGWGYFEGTTLRKRGDSGALPARMYQDGADHGTNCAGVVAAEADAALTVGAAPGCQLLPIKWESDGRGLYVSDSKMLTMLDYVKDRVDVLSSSWGMSPESLYSSAVTNRIRELARTGGRRANGILFLWAAGNENCPIQHDAAVDVPYGQGWTRLPSGDVVWRPVETARRFFHSLVGIPGVLHIAALASTAQRSHYSNYGTGIELCAPSSNSHAYWRMTVPGLSITTTSGTSSPVDTSFGGTSSATPLVAGVAALVISGNPALSALEVASILRRTASKDLDATGYARTPPATYDPITTWDVSPIAPFDTAAFRDIAHPDGTWSPWFGHGRVDAQAAVAAALELGRGATTTLKLVSIPEIPIPDNDPNGITDTVRVNGATGRTRDVRVALSLSHTWVGDLRIALRSPSGLRAVLHDRAGGNSDNIDRVFRASDTASLAALRGVEPDGEWTLEVSDLAAQDQGILKSWSLELELDGTATFSDAASITIPDNDATGVTRALQVAAAGTIADIAVDVDVTHSWIGDLRVELMPPSGSAVVLHDRAGNSADNLIRSYSSADVPALSALRGQSAQGQWRLRIVDLERQDVGKLNRWSLRITT